MEKKSKNLISKLTNKAIVSNLKNHINEVELLNTNLNNLRKFILSINYDDSTSKCAIDLYYRTINTFDLLANKCYTMRNITRKFHAELKTNKNDEIHTLLEEFKTKSKNLVNRIDRLDMNQIEKLFMLTPDADMFKKSTTTK